MPAADHGKAVGGRKVRRPVKLGYGLLASIDEIGIDFIISREGAHAEHPIFRLQGDVNAIGNVIRHERRYADAQVDIHTVFEFLRGPRGHLVAVPACH